MRVDVHTHFVPRLPDFGARDGGQVWPTFTVDATGTGELSQSGRVIRTVPAPSWSAAERIAEMDRRGIDHHVLSPLPPLVCQWGDRPESGEWTRAVNAALAAAVDTDRSRFSGFGIVSQNHPSLAAAEIEHAADLGLAGVLIGTDFDGRELDHPDLGDLFAAAERREMVVFVHPIAPTLDDTAGARIKGPEVTFGLGMGTDTAIAASRLVFGGIVERHPGLKVCLAHGGGTFFWALSRIARLAGGLDDPALVRRLSGIWVDSVVYERANLAYLLERVGADRIVYGTDYPLPAVDERVGSYIDQLPADVSRRILSDSARRLLGWERASA